MISFEQAFDLFLNIRYVYVNSFMYAHECTSYAKRDSSSSITSTWGEILAFWVRVYPRCLGLQKCTAKNCEGCGTAQRVVRVFLTGNQLSKVMNARTTTTWTNIYGVSAKPEYELTTHSFPSSFHPKYDFEFERGTTRDGRNSSIRKSKSLTRLQ